MSAPHLGICTWNLGAHEEAVQEASRRWEERDGTRRLWSGDPKLWTGRDEDRWIGWLRILDEDPSMVERLEALAADVASTDFQSVLLLGMGGSSLCPEVLSHTFGSMPGFPDLMVLDSTSPAQVRRVMDRIDPERTLYVVSSKSGGTTETNVLRETFHARLLKLMSPADAGRHFVAITDPGTSLSKLAQEAGFRHILSGEPDVGGRYSALSPFGMAPGACMGLDVKDFLHRARRMAAACGPGVSVRENPGVRLGIVLGTLAHAGRDKVTFLMTPEISSFGAWLEQLLAESTGKQGRGLVPVDAERLGPPEVYGEDRLFVVVAVRGRPQPKDTGTRLHQAGHPVVRIELEDKRDLGQEFFRWEVATAVAGAELGIHPFDQPDVESSKVATRELTSAYEQNRTLPADAPLLREGNLLLFASATYAQTLRAQAARFDLRGCVAAHFASLSRGDYFALLAYLEMNEANHSTLQRIRHCVRDTRHVATTLGFGPRFLHSTGQLHKGGPDSGLFLQITADAPVDQPIPARAYTFAQLQSFQAQGDFNVLADRGRRVLRLHLQGDLQESLESLYSLVKSSLAA